MTIASIAEFSDPRDSHVMTGVAKMPPLAVYDVDAADSPPVSAAFAARTRIVRVKLNGAGVIAIGEDPLEEGLWIPLNDGETEYFFVDPGHRIAIAESPSSS